MNLPPSLPEASHPILLPANCNTAAAEELQVRLVLSADAGQGTRVDASGVEMLGQACLQLLLAARHAALQANTEFDLLQPSPAFLDWVKRCCVGDALGLAVASEELS